MWVVGVGYKDGQRDPLGENTRGDILDLGFSEVKDVKTLQTYIIEGELKEGDMKSVGRELLSDNVVQFFSFDRFGENGKHVKKLVDKKDVWVVEVFFRPGVMDTVGLSVERALQVLGLKQAKVKTGTTYMISGEINEEELKTICEKCLANELIQTYRYQRM